MSRHAAIGLTFARYGLYVFLFVTQIVSPPPLSPGRLGAVAGLLLALSALGYILTEHRASPRMRLFLVGLEVCLIFAIGVIVGRGVLPTIIYFVAVADAFFFLPPPRAYAITVLAYGLLGVSVAVIEPEDFRLNEYVVSMLSLLAGFVFVASSVRLAVEQMAARQKTEHLLAQLETAHAKLQAYAVEVETLSVARERQRLAQEVHDSVAHVLTGLLMQLQAIRRLLQADPGRAAARLSAMEEAARRGLDDVRRAVRAMRPEHLEAVGGVEAMRRLCDQFAEHTGIRVNFVTKEDPRLTPAQEVLLYRTLQECLTNAARHGRASTIWARLRAEESGAELRVRDDGVGAGQVQPGMGIGGMRERARAAGGQFSYITTPGKGFEAVLELPREVIAAAKR